MQKICLKILKINAINIFYGSGESKIHLLSLFINLTE